MLWPGDISHGDQTVMLASWFLKEASVTGTHKLCCLHSCCANFHLWFSIPPYMRSVFLLKDTRQKETTSAKEDIFYLEICQCNQFVKWVHTDYGVLGKINPLSHRPQLDLPLWRATENSASGQRNKPRMLHFKLYAVPVLFQQLNCQHCRKCCGFLSFVLFSSFFFCACSQFFLNSLLDSIERAQFLSPKMINCHNCDDIPICFLKTTTS